jgi:membrane fusion protein, multidrug efflux system
LPFVQRSHLIAGAITLVLILYFVISGMVRGALNKDEGPAVVTKTEIPQAVITRVKSQVRDITLSAKGRTAPDKSVTVSAGTMGTVVSTPAIEGAYVRRGALLCGLDVEARSARVREAEALRETARIDFEAAKTLATKGLAPANQQTSAQARLDAAEAAVNAAKVELGKTQIRAPFDGIFERRLAETGDFLGMGAPCGLLVDMSPVLVTAEVSEAEAGKLAAGATGEAVLADGRTYPAKLRYVARTANAATRTYAIEAELDTGKDVVAAGVSSEIRMPAGTGAAVLITPALLTLSDGGDIGVRFVDANNIVQFAKVTVVEESPAGAWVIGLPDSASLIAIGQDYLAEGVRVTPVMQTGAVK